MKTLSFALAATAIHLILIAHSSCTNLAASKTCNDCPNYGSFLTCDPETCTWLLLNGYWAGYISVNGTQGLLVGGCPMGYCALNESSGYVWVPQSMSEMISDFVCNATHRMGIICGQCQPGYGPAINSDLSECVSCDTLSSMVNWIYYILAIYVPHLVVFLTIVILNIRLTTGPLNAFLLYAQVISTTLNPSQQGSAPLNLVYGKGASAFQYSYQVPYNFFNLNILGNLLPPFCLHANLDTLDVITLKYIEAFFPVLIIIAIIILLKCQSCLRCSAPDSCYKRKCRVSVSLEQAFAAFVLLSYNRLCEITAYLLTPVPVFGSNLKTQDKRVYFQGSYSITDSNYAVHYKVPAYIVLVILIILPITLLHYPVRWVEKLIGKVVWLMKVYPTASVAILLDTFQGCFKDNRRYFAGLYLALRLLLFFAYFQPILLQLLIQQIFITVYIFLLAFLKPYKVKHLNYLDISIFKNMAIINGLSWFTVNEIEPDPIPLKTTIIFESILVYLPLLNLVAYLLWHATVRYHDRMKQKVMELHCKIKGGNVNSNQEMLHANDATTVVNYSDFDALIERAAEQEERQCRNVK